jgi:nitrite reductase (NADH) large subunit
MARVCATHLAENGLGRFRGAVPSTQLKVTGVDVFSIGDFQGGPEADEITLSDPTRGIYKKLVIADGRLTGAVLIGDVTDALWYLELIRTRQPTARIRADMMFGRSLAIRSEAA